MIINSKEDSKIWTRALKVPRSVSRLDFTSFVGTPICSHCDGILSPFSHLEPEINYPLYTF